MAPFELPVRVSLGVTRQFVSFLEIFREWNVCGATTRLMVKHCAAINFSDRRPDGSEPGENLAYGHEVTQGIRQSRIEPGRSISPLETQRSVRVKNKDLTNLQL